MSLHLATCIGCGCDDYHACEGGCWWIRVDRNDGVGVCSECEGFVEQWDRGDRTRHAESAQEFEAAERAIDEFHAQGCPKEITDADRAEKRLANGQCDHNWPRMEPRMDDSCTRCGMSFTRHVFWECA